MACRNTEKAEKAKIKIAENEPNYLNKIDIRELDIKDLNSIKRFLNELEQNNIKIDILVNNAAIGIISDIMG